MRRIATVLLVGILFWAGLVVARLDYCAAAEEAKLVFFRVPGCPKCLKVERALAKLDQSRFVLTTKQISVAANRELLEEFEEIFQVPDNQRGVVPKLFLGDRFYVGEEIDFAAVAAELAKPAENSRIDRALQNKGENREAVARILARFASFSWLTVALAGLVDGINPCAIATLIFFISFLFFNQNSRRQIAAVGLSFIFGMFLAYFLLGLGFLKAVYSLSGINLIAKLLYPLLTLIVLILAVVSLRDYFKMKAGCNNEVALQLPASFKKMIHGMIRSKYFIKVLPVYGFVTGFGISLVEFLCTGQVYLPTIVYIVSLPGYRASGLVYLIVYNICFILPLVAIFAVAYVSASAAGIKKYVECNLKFAKLLLFIFFLILAVYMAWQSWLLF